MTHRARAFSLPLTTLAFLTTSFVIGCSGTSDDGGGQSSDVSSTPTADGDPTSGTTNGDEDGDADPGSEENGAMPGDGDAGRAGAASGDGDGDGDGEGNGGSAGDGDGAGAAPGDGDGDAPEGPCTTGEFAPSPCGICSCGESGEWECVDIPELCPTPCEGDSCCGGAAYPEFEACPGAAGWQCVSEQWTCNAGSDCPYVASAGRACLGVVVGAENPETGTCCQFGSPCNVPAGWLSCGDLPVIDSR